MTVKFNYVIQKVGDLTTSEGLCSLPLEEKQRLNFIYQEPIIEVIFTKDNVGQMVWVKNLVPLDAEAELFIVKAKLGVFDIEETKL